MSAESPSSITAPSDWASELAKQLIVSKATPPAGLDDAQSLALAWALKDAAIAAWSSAPSDVVVAAEALGALRGAVPEGTASPSDTEVQAIAAWVKGIAELTRGKMTDAIKHLDDATERFRAVGQQGHAANAQVPKMMAFSVLGQHEEAAACGIAALPQLINSGEVRAASTVGLNLGNLYYYCENYTEALRHYREASAFFATIDDHEHSMMSDIGMANVYTSTGDSRAAALLFKQVEIQARQYSYPVLESMALGAASLLHLARGDYRQALAELELSRRRFESLDIPQHLATTEKLLGDVYLELRLLPEALALFDRALERFEALEMPLDKAVTLTQRGRALVALARPQSEVADSLIRAWNQFTALGVSAGQAAVLLARAELALAQGEPHAATTLAAASAETHAASSLAPGQAQSNVIRAYALLQCADVDGAARLFADTIARANDLQLLSVVVRCRVGLGLVAQARGEVAVAEAAFESAIAASEEQRSVLPGDDIRRAFLIDQLRPYEEVLRIALDAFDRAPSKDVAARVLVQLERFRARVLGERLGETKDHSSASHANDPDLDLRARLSWLYRRRQKLIDDGEDSQSLTIEARRIERELLELARRRRLTADTNATSIDAIAFDPAILQSALGDSEALVEYGVVDDELFACVVTRDRIALQRRLARWPDVVDAIRSARFQIETLRYGAGAVERHAELLTRRSRAAMRRVHDLVWAPLQPLLTGYNKALIVAHDQLGSLQFAALYDGENNLAQTMNLAMAPSAKVALYGMAHQPVAAKSALVLGESSRLVHAADEANFVAGLFDHANVLVGTEANAVALRTACVDADVLHLACHAEFRSDNPMFSALQLVDGPFTVQDAETLQLRQGIVVLSACETGVAVYSRGDEMIGLVRAFLVAGASRVVASLWPVDDAVTLQFMAAFYHALHGGSTPSTALRAAQLDVMQTHPHPFHWAAFTLYGGW